MDDTTSVRSLVGAPVRLGNITIGVVADVFFARNLGHALGLSVANGDGEEQFVPWIGVRLERGRVHVTSPTLVLTHPREKCRARARSAVELLERQSATFELLLAEDGDVVAIVDWSHTPQSAASSGIRVTVSSKPESQRARAA